MTDLTVKREDAGCSVKTRGFLCLQSRGCNGQTNPDTWWLQGVVESQMEWHRPAAGWNPDETQTLIHFHDLCLFTFSSEVVDTRENADRIIRSKPEAPGSQGMARPRPRFRVIIILLLGTSLVCFPARPLPLLASSFSSLRHCLNQLPQKPLRLRMFHSGPSAAVTEQRTDQGRDRRPARVNRQRQATPSWGRLAGPPPERIASALPVHPLRC
jgi:hypothetical protein